MAATLLISSIVVVAVPGVAFAADDDDPWFVEATSSPSGTVGSVFSPLTSEADCSQPDTRNFL